MLTELLPTGLRLPHGPAIRCLTPDGGWAVTTWAQLEEAAQAAAARARLLPDGGPIIVVVDGTADSIATMLGATAAGVDVLLLEEQSSYLTDPWSPVHAVGATLIVGPAALSGAAGTTPFEPYDRFRAPADQRPPEATRAGEVLQLTSGSTGVPRVARQPLANVLTGGRLYQRLFHMTDQDQVLVAVPVAHSYGLAGLCSALLSGATLVTIPRFRLTALVEGLTGGATMLLGTPLLYRLLTPVLAARRSRLGLRIALSAGGPMPTDNIAEVTSALGTPVRQIYGTTEAGLIACVPQSRSDWPAGSVGPAAPGVTLRIASPEAEPGDPDTGGGEQTGRLLVRTPMMFSGYVGDQGDGLTGDGFYDTGDTVRIGRSGDVFVLGRRDNVVNIGGRKVSPHRVERVLAAHPAVREAFVYGVERADHEQEMHAAVVLGPGTGVDDLLDFCRSQALRAYEVPHRVHVLNRLPRNSMGKVDRQQILAQTGHIPAPRRPPSHPSEFRRAST